MNNNIITSDGVSNNIAAASAVAGAIQSMQIDDDRGYSLGPQYLVASDNSDVAVNQLACRLADHIRLVRMNGREDEVVRFLVCLCECLNEFRSGDMQCRKPLKRIHFPGGNALMPALAADLIDKEYRQFLANCSVKVVALVVEDFTGWLLLEGGDLAERLRSGINVDCELVQQLVRLHCKEGTALHDALVSTRAAQASASFPGHFIPQQGRVQYERPLNQERDRHLPFVSQYRKRRDRMPYSRQRQ